MLDIQPLTTRRLTPAGMCLLAIATSLPIFVWHWLHFALLLREGGLEAVTRPAVLAGLNAFLLGIIACNVALVAWLWSRRHHPDPLPRTATLVAVVQVVGYCAMAIVFGPLTSPLNTVIISALAVGLALLGRRPTVIGFFVALFLLTANDWLVMGGVLPYAPGLVPGSFTGGQPVAWWAAWQDSLFYAALVFGMGLVIWLFARIDGQRRLLEKLSRTDGLTGLSNRRHFMERLAIELHRRDRYNLPFCLVLCDADHFKKVNDTWGHHAGDEVLRRIGVLLGSGLRVPGDVAARLGGEEFGLLLTDCREAEAAVVCERLRAQLEAEAIMVDGHAIRVTISMGAIECRSGDLAQVLKAADVNLYRAKSDGRNRAVVSVLETAP